MPSLTKPTLAQRIKSIHKGARARQASLKKPGSRLASGWASPFPKHISANTRTTGVDSRHKQWASTTTITTTTIPHKVYRARTSVLLTHVPLHSFTSWKTKFLAYCISQRKGAYLMEYINEVEMGEATDMEGQHRGKVPVYVRCDSPFYAKAVVGKLKGHEVGGWVLGCELV